MALQNGETVSQPNPVLPILMSPRVAPLVTASQPSMQSPMKQDALPLLSAPAMPHQPQEPTTGHHTPSSSASSSAMPPVKDRVKESAQPSSADSDHSRASSINLDGSEPLTLLQQQQQQRKRKRAGGDADFDVMIPMKPGSHVKSCLLWLLLKL